MHARATRPVRPHASVPLAFPRTRVLTMTDTAAASTRPPAFGDLEPELATTRRVLERVADEHWDWKPHERSKSMGALATHLAEIPFLASKVLSADEFEAGGGNRWPQGAPTNREQLLAAWDAAAAAVTSAIAAVPADGWRTTWSLKNAGQVFMSMPRAAALRVLGINHLVHHRAQLTVYLRLLDIPVPSVYGPSADEMRPPA
jgi:uncharacterized damage-inducible protein DinB